MIRATRINGNEFVVNVEFIKFIEETPDTIITLRGGEKLLVKETADELVERSIDFIRSTRFPPDLP